MDESISNDVVKTTAEKPYEDNHISQQTENKQMAEEFNAQRAKMKELFLQKEDEVRRLSNEKQDLECELESVREQLMQFQLLSSDQQSEIKTLQYLVQETIEASSSAEHSREEAKRLQQRCFQLEQRINLMNKQASSQEVSLAPSVLVQAVTKSIVKKLGADGNSSQDLEDSMKKAQEDAEMLKCLVLPLEEEIKMLKDKLRETDTQLQNELQNKKSGSPNQSCGSCDMCANYEAQLVGEQRKCAEVNARAVRAERALELAKEELESCNSIHSESLTQWSTSRELMERQLAALAERVESAEALLSESNKKAMKGCASALHRVTSLTVDRDELQRTIDEVAEQNDMLIGRCLPKFEELQNEEISFPDTVSELQERCLTLREELLVACVGREVAVEELTKTREQLAEFARSLERYEIEAKEARLKIENLEAEQGEMQVFADRLREAETQLEKANADKSALQDRVDELRGRICSLQTELDTSEKVQQDFVRLSQSLQVQLERIRESEREVRWQHDDDVSDCTECRKPLNSKQKFHCRHCGRILCAECLSESVPCGPRRQPVRVCRVCHTLLQPHSAPYFSQT